MRNIIHSESLATKRPTERGSALVVALMCLLALFAITFAATKIRVASARDVEDTEHSSNSILAGTLRRRHYSGVTNHRYTGSI